MSKVPAKTKTLFKKAYYHNWDNGRAVLKKILEDKACDKATALLIFWRGSPGYYYNHNTGELIDYEQEEFAFLRRIAADVLSGRYPALIAYKPESLPAELGKIPAAMAEPVTGVIDYNDVLWPDTNPFDGQVFALCSNCGSVEEMYALEKQGADFSRTVQKGYSYPIEIAVNYSQAEAVKYFIEKGFDLDKKYNKNPLLFNAVSRKEDAILKLLVESGAKVNQKGEFGRTVLHHVASLGWLGDFNERLKSKVEYLVAHGADIHARDTDKKTPRDLAAYWKNEAYVAFLDSLG